MDEDGCESREDSPDGVRPWSSPDCKTSVPVGRGSSTCVGPIPDPGTPNGSDPPESPRVLRTQSCKGYLKRMWGRVEGVGK